ncbi:LLM class flavin-dependent oxidoreductase [Nocardioides zeae]|uniref:LLM class flavin-dependent oxidoreductase n=1 Tax=Nocardioides zeae TaxID=1457234 RepID=A0A6P0HHX6_9ACTN|nr:LLM class flavin-dependent oxidoreductase [Nocardioides zeae]NEN78146.1 LLM class flavin-dependent oxidoreductase [Nocardioides zeae]
MTVQLGLDTFGDVSSDATGAPVPHAQVIRDLVEQAVLADGIGVDAIGIGEHHRDDYAVSAPDIVLAAIASRTERILLGTAVTVLSSDDPVRVYERFATLDALAPGRAEVTMGRGSFTESFPLFGLDLGDYERLFEEKLDLWAALQGEGEVSWEGSVRGPLQGARVFPTTAAGRIPTWIGVGGSPESVVRAASYRFPMMLAIIGGEPGRFAPYVDLYHRALRELHPERADERLPVGVHSPGFVADTDDEARELLFPHFKANRDRIGRERGWGPATRAQFDAEADAGSLYVGSPETVAQKIAATVRTLGIDRFDLKYSNGPQPHAELLRCIELYGTQVAPRVRELLAD